MVVTYPSHTAYTQQVGIRIKLEWELKTRFDSFNQANQHLQSLTKTFTPLSKALNNL